MKITALNIDGFRSFQNMTAEFTSLQVIVGANGTGKTSLFDFLRFLRDAMAQEIPPQVVRGAIGEQPFHSNNNEQIDWSLTFDNDLVYHGKILGPVGQIKVIEERLVNSEFTYLAREDNQRGKIYEDSPETPLPQSLNTGKPSTLLLNTVNNAMYGTTYTLKEYIDSWRFYGGFTFNKVSLRRPVLIEESPQLVEDGRNLSALLHFLMTEHRLLFNELETHLQSVIPNFEYLTVKARGGPGEVMAFWKERGSPAELSLADLSDGILRLLAWLALCLHPNPPQLICIDEPDIGIHPRALALLAGLLQKASLKSQILITTHQSYLLSCFDLEQIAIMRKEQGQIVFRKPANSAMLVDMLETFGLEEIIQLHQSDELEKLS